MNDFKDNQYYKKRIEEEAPYYCINDPNSSLTTTANKPMVIIIEKCREGNSRNIKCSSDEEIDKWL